MSTGFQRFSNSLHVFREREIYLKIPPHIFVGGEGTEAPTSFSHANTTRTAIGRHPQSSSEGLAYGRPELGGGVSSLGKFPGYLGRECHPEPGKILERLATCGEDGSWVCASARPALGVPAGHSGRFHHSIVMQSAPVPRAPVPTQRGLPAAFPWLKNEERKVLLL